MKGRSYVDGRIARGQKKKEEADKEEKGRKTVREEQKKGERRERDDRRWRRKGVKRERARKNRGEDRDKIRNGNGESIKKRRFQTENPSHSSSPERIRTFITRTGILHSIH